jgi:hypothetical protein
LSEALPYVPDNGFTTRVLQQLPQKRSNPWLRWCIFSSVLILAGALILWQWPMFSASFGGLGSLSFSSLQTGVWLALLPAVIVFGSFLWMIYSFAMEEE